jgi:hypothetical protein
MNAAAIIALITSLLSVAPELLSLLPGLSTGATVNDADVTAIFTKYGVDEQTTAALIAAAKAAGH